ncbi:hypothetical protein [Sphingobium sp. CAP-1]|uniref:hypothetical protein n=1 Tax=Sphingobium sp. CAP-1 TaxID=2676077 RepID=UPI0012BB23C8|nr:hypothetical protein [Sphingobium sp. CAP-1]QGP80027.1 hypothetical protein GL174_14300 [Sphingobium sp. CAP-1]
MSEAKIKARQDYPYVVARAGGKLPRFRFQDVGEAGEDAERQSQQRPGATFIVMKEIARVSTPIPAANPPRRSAEPGDHAPRSPGSKGGA